MVVLAISTILEIGASSTISSIGSPAAENTAVALIVAVPGTPTVPTDTTSDGGLKMHIVSVSNQDQAH